MLLLYLIALVLLLIASLSYKEGFEGGQYAYLAPSDPIKMDASTQSKFIKAYNESGGLVFNKFIITNENIDGVVKDITLEEVNYYIQNNKWPYGSYIMNYLTVNKEDLLNKSKQLTSLDDLQKTIPTRLIYRYLIQSTESQLSPLPLSNNIYMGKAVAPVDKPVLEIKEKTTATIHPPFSTENYTKLQSICSTLR
uniref:Uncharacterized protein n=1 Tax=viral metagenome TaxID=1070528 RepID=A0A6C0HXF6_9ZZZZ